MKSDLKSVIDIKPCINPAAALTGNAVTTGATIDVKGFGSLVFALQTGVITDGTFSSKVYGGDASNMSDEVELTAAELIGSLPAIAITDDGVVERVGVNLAVCKKRYFRIKATQAGATSGGFLAAHAILGNPDIAPVA